MHAPRITVTALLLCATLVFSIRDSVARPVVKKPGKPSPVLFVLDASGSMAIGFGEISRMAAARTVLMEHLVRLKSEVPIGLMAYGNGIQGCHSSRLYTPISTGNRDFMTQTIRRMYPAGRTPLAATLRMIRRDILPKHPGTRVIVISDGAESCGGNPVVEAAKLRLRGARVSVIGLSVTNSTSRQLGAVARAGYGRYHRVTNRLDFERAFHGSLHSDPRRARNAYVERKWNNTTRLPYARPLPRRITPRRAPLVKPLPPQVEPPFVLTAVRKKEVRGDITVFTVDYRFKGFPGGDYFVSALILPNPAHPGPRGRIRPGDALLSMAGETFYGVRAGKGRIELEIPSVKLAGRPIFVQGELWKTTEVPGTVYISNSLALQ